MTVEIRPPRGDELTGYYRCLPFANGLPMWEPAPAAWHGGPEPWPRMRPPADAEGLVRIAREDARDGALHPVGAFVDGTCVGATGTLDMAVTVPGGASIPVAGVTATGVVATARRRGHLRSMMQHLFDDALARNIPLSMLSASEGGIYGNFGFAPATRWVRWEIARAEAALRPGPEDTGTLHLVDAATAREVWPGLHAAVRAGRPGELTPPAGRWDGLSDAPDATGTPVRYLLHRDAEGAPDGIAHYRLPWGTTAEDAGTLVVERFEALTPAAYRAMWALFLDFDLTKRVVAPMRPRQEPLRWLLRNPRALRITREADSFWARLLDVPACLAARTYGSARGITLRVDEDAMCPANAGTWRLEPGPDVVACAATEAPADVTLTIGALSSLYLGGVSAHELAFAGLVTEHAAGAVDALERLFRIDPEPFNSQGF